MKIILLTLFSLVNSYFIPNHRSLVITKNKKWSEQDIERFMDLEQYYLKNKIKKLENIRNKIKELIDEEYSTEWDFYNQTWRKK
jgi:hypothetical protein